MAVPNAVLDAQLRRAIGLHQARRLAEAETAYREVLAFRPDMAEIQVNCALAQLGQGKYCDAEASLRRAIATLPGLAKAHSYLGVALRFQQRYRDAIGCFQQAVRLKTDYFEAYNDLGNTYSLLGEAGQAVAAYRNAIELKPDFAQAHNNLGLTYLHQGLLTEARAAFDRAIAITPSYVEAHNNLGNALRKLGLAEEAGRAFETAIRLAPAHADAHLNWSAHLHDLGKFSEAEKSARQAVRLAPAVPEGHNALGNALREQGKLSEAVTQYQEALRLSPDYAEGYKHLAMALEELGQLEEAFALFRRHGELSHSSAADLHLAHKLRHDEEQFVWLGPGVGAYHVGDGGRVAGAAVNPANRVSEISAQWKTAEPQIVVIDDLLTAEALGKLRRFCLESTVWRKVYDGGYLGAFPEHGFAPPLLAQIAEELRAVYPAIIEDYPLLHFWAFKYDSSLLGIKKHADFAAVNVNFWITPDEANLDPEHGGLVVWDVAAPLDWNFAKYNAAEEDILSFLAREKAKPVTIAYRANRAVIFDSDLFHETDTIRFKPGYENRRINVTLLFGRRQKHRGRAR
jgi:tetratricopeptide (TPR) repeat protein